MFGIPQVNRNSEFPPAEIPINNGGDGRYIYVLNCGDQTVSVIDSNSDTVVSTITLSASKSFASLFYRALDLSVYVLGVNYFDRIDANPSSGSFNTIVESGATIISSAINCSYIAWPIDTITAPATTYRWIPVKYINNSAEAGKDYNWSSNSVIRGQMTHGHDFGRNTRLHPKSKLLESSLNGGGASTRFGRILQNSKNLNVNSPYTIIGNHHPNDLDDDMVASYVFGNLRLTTTNGSVYGQYTDYNYSSILFLTGVGLANSLYFLEYAPNAKRVFWGTKTIYAQSAVFDIGKNTYSSVGILNRAAYKATNEDATEDIMYCPFNGKIYMQGKRHSVTTTGVNKIHVYDPTLALGSMYLSSITVGEMASTLRHGNYSVNAMCMNRTRYWEAPEVIY